MQSKTTEHVLDKESFDKFLNQQMTVAEDRVYRIKVDERFNKIINMIFSSCGYEVEYFDYLYQPSSHEYSQLTQNAFNYDAFKENVFFISELTPLKDCLDLKYLEFKDNFPISWFYSDFSEELSISIAQSWEKFKKEQQNTVDEKEEHSQKFEQYAEDIERAKQKIYELVPSDLLQYIRFIHPQEVEQNIKVQENVKKKFFDTQVKKIINKGIDVKSEFLKYKENGGLESFNEWFIQHYQE